MTQKTTLKVAHLEDIYHHYARTLRDWHDRFNRKIDQVRTQGYSEEFIRMWRFYLWYCQAGFEARHLGTVQMLITQPDAKPADVNY